MAIAAGTRFGPYEIVSPIGAGGMGEVYRALDTRLGRTVAIKVLPPSPTSDPERGQRFEREARAISSLNHPYICTLHDVGQQDGVDYLVLEHLEGETLQKRLENGAIPIPEALKIAIDLSDALDKAHRHGIVHRDLKPGNIMLTKSGPKLMDFGLAKPTEAAFGATNSALATMTRSGPLTAEGTIVGTFQYMAPEQMEGREADARSDIFAFGAVLYEMVTGKAAFAGRTTASVIASVLASEPKPISALQPMSPVALEYLVAGCLAKDPEERLQTAHDLNLQLRSIAATESAIKGSQPGTKASAGKIARYEKWLWPAACAALGLLALAALWHGQGSTAKPQTVRFQIEPPPKSTIGFGLIISPDGTQLCMVLSSNGVRSLATRMMGSTDIHNLPGTEGAQFPFWSPDSRSIGFFAGNKLKRIDLANGSVQTLTDVIDSDNIRGGDWGKNGDIIFAPGTRSSLYRVPSAGGTPSEITTLKEEDSHRWPHFLPDGQHFTYFARGGTAVDKVFIGSLASGERRELLMGTTGAQVVRGYLLFVRGRTLFAQPFDEGSLKTTAEPVALADGVQVEGDSGPTRYAPFSASDNGVLVYLAEHAKLSQLTWFDRNGNKLATMGPPGKFSEPSLSPDGSRVALDQDYAKGRSVWILDLGRGVMSRISLDSPQSGGAVWSPDGKYVAFNAGSNNPGFSGINIVRKASNGTGGEEKLWELVDQIAYVDDWSPDGQNLMLETTTNSKSGQPLAAYNLSVLPLHGGAKARPFVESRFNTTHAAFSPNGRWLAYSSDYSGKPEIYIQDFPDAKIKLQVSTDGGDEALWRRDGKELFYTAPNLSLMSVSVNEGNDLKVGAPKSLFTLPVRNGGITDDKPQYAIAADGRILVNALIENTPSPVNVVINWTSEMKK